jgi:gas vesicle protein
MGYFKGIATGAMLGAAAGMLISPQLDKNTKRRLRRSSNIMMGTIGNMMDDMMRKMR